MNLKLCKSYALDKTVRPTIPIILLPHDYLLDTGLIDSLSPIICAFVRSSIINIGNLTGTDEKVLSGPISDSKSSKV